MPFGGGLGKFASSPEKGLQCGYAKSSACQSGPNAVSLVALCSCQRLLSAPAAWKPGLALRGLPWHAVRVWVQCVLMERSQGTVVHGTLSSVPTHCRVKFQIYFFPCDPHLSESLLNTFGRIETAKEPAMTKQRVCRLFSGQPSWLPSICNNMNFCTSIEFYRHLTRLHFCILSPRSK